MRCDFNPDERGHHECADLKNTELLTAWLTALPSSALASRRGRPPSVEGCADEGVFSCDGRGVSLSSLTDCSSAVLSEPL